MDQYVKMMQDVSLEDYRLLLKDKVSYVIDGDYLVIGDIPQVEGWLIELGVIQAELDVWINILVNELIALGVCFKIPKNKKLACAIIHGRKSLEQMARVVVVYPINNLSAIAIAEKLVAFTSSFRSPEIRSSSWLGGTVYVRYDFFKNKNLPIGSFKLPIKHCWPFGKIHEPIVYKVSDVLGKAYRFSSFIKENRKGDAIKAIYYKSIFNMGYCFIKQARRNVFMDKYGRDARDRLKWQYALHMRLAGKLKLPLVLDYFDYYGDEYLVMELLKGDALTKVISAKSGSLVWRDLDKKSKRDLLVFLLDIFSQVSIMHENGIVHRDLSTENFVITKSGIYMIDLELAYDLVNVEPNPPFPGITNGFSEPTRFDDIVPKFEDDIYGLGGLMIAVFTNMPPAPLLLPLENSLESCIKCFTGSKELAVLISSCVAVAPEARPSLTDIIDCVRSYKEVYVERAEVAGERKKEDIQVLVDSVFLKGLYFLNFNEKNYKEKIWVERVRISVYSDLESIILSDFRDGLSGSLYFISTLMKLNIEKYNSCIDVSFHDNFNFLVNSFLNASVEVEGGLLKGSYGIALALSACMSSGMIPDDDEYKKYIEDCLFRPFTGLDLFSGAAGLGLAVLNSRKFLKEERALELMEKVFSCLKQQQQSGGEWMFKAGDGKMEVLPGLFNGVAGVVLFLWKYWRVNKNDEVLNLAESGTDWLINFLTSKLDSKKITSGIGNYQAVALNNGIAGIVSVFLVAYESTKDSKYQIVADNVLTRVIPYIHYSSLDYNEGSAGIGDLYLSAWRVLGKNEYKLRADLIAEKIVLTAASLSNESCFWPTSHGDLPGTGLLGGQSGILYFLLRYLYSDKIPQLFIGF